MEFIKQTLKNQDATIARRKPHVIVAAVVVHSALAPARLRLPGDRRARRYEVEERSDANLEQVAVREGWLAGITRSAP
jgi:hypothetical protein